MGTGIKPRGGTALFCGGWSLCGHSGRANTGMFEHCADLDTREGGSDEMDLRCFLDKWAVLFAHMLRRSI